MTQEEILQLLEALSVGEEVAEHEPELPKVFIKDIEVYRRLIRDEVDLITGGKGTGKSAIYRMITETLVGADLVVLAASNPSGAPEFRALFNGDDSEERLRSIWLVYLASLVGNHVVNEYEGVGKTAEAVGELREILELMGLRKKPISEPSLLSRIRRARTVETGLQGGAAGFQLGASLKFELEGSPTSNPKAVVLDYPDFSAILQTCGEILRENGARVWVAIDRLDECFLRNSETERRALRSLLRATLDCAHALKYTPYIRIKVFLRTDLFTRISEDGAFTNATHLRRNDISWTFNSMADLIAHRLIESSPEASAFITQGINHEVTSSAWESVLPDIGTRPTEKSNRYTTAQQLCLWTTDGSGLYNPRNLITLMNLVLLRARENQRRALSLGRASRTSRPLVRDGEVQAALGELSRRRLQDTVVNEFPAVSRLADKLSGGPVEYLSRKALLQRLGFPDDSSSEAGEALNSLILSGLVGRRDGGIYQIPRLYWAGTRTSRGK